MSGLSKWSAALAVALAVHLIVAAPLLWLMNSRPSFNTADRPRPNSVIPVRMWGGPAPASKPEVGAGNGTSAERPKRGTPRKSIASRAPIPQPLTEKPLQSWESAAAIQDESVGQGAADTLGTNGNSLGQIDGRGAGPVGAARTAAPGSGRDLQLEEIHRRLAAAAERCYPPKARRFHLEGSALLGFCLDESGATRDAHLIGQTGHQLLDDAVLDCVVPQAAPLPPRPGCYQVPVKFQNGL